ncbi:hypothetical protein [Aeromonas veronii]
MNITTIGIDLAKSCIQVHCVDVHGKRILNKKLVLLPKSTIKPHQPQPQ